MPRTDAAVPTHLDEAINPSVRSGSRLPPPSHDKLQLVFIFQLIGPERSCFSGDDAGGFDHVPRQLLGHTPAVAPHDLQLRPGILIWSSFSWAKASEVTMWSGYPLTAHTSARDTPVLPPVYSTTDPFGKTSILLRRLDHGERLPVLHAAGWVLALQFELDTSTVPWNDIAQSQ